MEKIDYIYVSDGPIADFIANPTSGIRALSVQFVDQSLGTVNDYYWEFGDGNTRTEQDPLHVYELNL